MEAVTRTVTINGVAHEFTDLFGPYLAIDAPEDEPIVDEPMTLDQRETRLGEIRARLQELDSQYAGQQYPTDVRDEYNSLNEERERHGVVIEELRVRMANLAEVAQDDQRRESSHTPAPPRRGSPRSAAGEDIWDLTTIPRSYTDPQAETRELRDRAMRAVDQAVFPHKRADQASAKEDIAQLLAGFDDESNARAAAVARRILVTGRPAYQRAFAKWLSGRETACTTEERAALAVGAGATGGFAIVYTLDPTIIKTSNLSVNPYRGISRVETIAGTNEWRGVTSDGVTAAYAAEATEASDNSPTLVQPAAVVQRAQCFIPFSFEAAQDWGGLQGEMAEMIQDAKDDLEAVQFTTGAGTTVFPQGVITGATNTVAASTLLTFSSPDPYLIEGALPPRFRPRAQWVANRSIWSRLRQFDTAGGAQLWQYVGQGLPNNVPTPGNLNAQVLGYPTNEASAMSSAVTTGQKILVLGDFRYFLIVDRVGLDIEVVPHLFGAANRFPTGQRGLFAMWRNTAKVLSASAFRVLTT